MVGSIVYGDSKVAIIESICHFLGGTGERGVLPACLVVGLHMVIKSFLDALDLVSGSAKINISTARTHRGF